METMDTYTDIDKATPEGAFKLKDSAKEISLDAVSHAIYRLRGITHLVMHNFENKEGGAVSFEFLMGALHAIDGGLVQLEALHYACDMTQTQQ